MYKSIMPLLCVTELQFIRFATVFAVIRTNNLLRFSHFADYHCASAKLHEAVSSRCCSGPSEA